MKRSLNTREKRLLILCVLTIVVVGNALAIRAFMSRLKTAKEDITTLEKEERDNRIWLNDRAAFQKRLAWINQHMPYTPSEGKSKGELLDFLVGSARDVGLNPDNENPLDSLALELDNKDIYANEVAVSMRVRGDLDTMQRWLLTLQGHDRFTVIKAIELELDSRSKEKTPHAQCNITVARWFNPTPPPANVTAVPVVAPAAAPAPSQPAASTEALPNPLEITSPLDGIPVDNSQQ
ncbi:hypothetical protein AYO49_00035 [Verrucomicrobiaceae bacterium SCGC AG-212-N21]|nr:hypothetical protein AYO49_00035 [Verrucomicrobiaceae bacterium SCGC AG-212-N21]